MFLAAMVGLALACGGSSALNHVMDADIDRLMGERTAARPVASGRVAAPRALEFGVVLMALSFALLASTLNVLTAVLALIGAQVPRIELGTGAVTTISTGTIRAKRSDTIPSPSNRRPSTASPRTCRTPVRRRS